MIINKRAWERLKNLYSCAFLYHSKICKQIEVCTKMLFYLIYIKKIENWVDKIRRVGEND